MTGTTTSKQQRGRIHGGSRWSSPNARSGARWGSPSARPGARWTSPEL